MNLPKPTPQIFVDLDDCLVLAKPSRGELRPPRQRIELEGGDRFDVLARPVALGLLQALRRIAPVRMLTTAQRPYTLQINAACRLGFAEDEVVCRDDLFKNAEFMFLEGPQLKATDVAPGSVLIDNLPAQDAVAKLKMKYLGIRRSRYLQITPFAGRDTRAIVIEVATLLERVQTLLGVPSSASQP